MQVLHVVGPEERRGAPGPGVPTYVPIGFVDRMDYALAAADLMVCRAGASSVTEAAAVGVPAIFVPLPIGNGEQALQRQAGRRGRGSAAGGRRRRSPRAWVTATRAGAGHGRRPAGRDERRRLGADPARRRREAGPDRAGDRRMKSRCRRAAPADRLGHVHLVGIGGAGLSGDRPDHAGPRRSQVSGSDGVDVADPRRAARPGRDGARRPRPAHLDHLGDGGHASSSRPRSARTTRSTPRRLGARLARAAAVGGRWPR